MKEGQISKVYHVVDEVQGMQFERYQRHLEKKMREPNERMLFHATSRRNMGSIISGGFDIRLSGSKNGQALGAGIYMACEAVHSDTYAELDIKGQSCMFICRVLLGKIGPDKLNDSHGSTRMGQYAVRRERQILPVYVIYYQR